MEDSHIANLDLGDDKYLFGVFDGHGGTNNSPTYFNLLGMEVSEFVKRHFTEELKKNSNYLSASAKSNNNNPNIKQYQKALRENFM